MNNSPYFSFIKGNSPIVATAIHDGHLTREGLHSLFKLNDDERLREEDPFTANWLDITDNRIIVHQSRFQTDVNRTREKAVYQKPEDAWGLDIWNEPLTEKVIEDSYKIYDEFYKNVKRYFDDLFKIHNKIVVYDIHSYNHRRDGANMEADPKTNPDINIGTQNLDDATWRPLIDILIVNFSNYDYPKRELVIGENVKFKGGYFGQWLYEHYGKKICPISIEFKKFFMDEWTGKPYEEHIQWIHEMLQQSIPIITEGLQKITIE